MVEAELSAPKELTKVWDYQTLTEQQLSGVYQVYHSDDLWHDYYEQTSYLWISAVKIQYTDGTSAYYSGNNLKACIW